MLRSRWACGALVGALVTPWCAAAAGIVIAAVLSLESPHQVLTLGRPAWRQCSQHGCVPRRVRRPVSGSAAAGQPHLPDDDVRPATAHRARHLGTAPHRAARPRPAAGSSPAPAPTPTPTPTPSRPPERAAVVTVHFQLLSGGQSGFVASITVHSSQQIGDWTLQFALPRARIDSVLGASWQRLASGSGAMVTGQPWPWPHPGNQARITILGTGTPGPPADCVFDGTSCSFS